MTNSKQNPFSWKRPPQRGKSCPVHPAGDLLETFRFPWLMQKALEILLSP